MRDATRHIYKGGSVKSCIFMRNRKTVENRRDGCVTIFFFFFSATFKVCERIIFQKFAKNVKFFLKDGRCQTNVKPRERLENYLYYYKDQQKGNWQVCNINFYDGVYEMTLLSNSVDNAEIMSFWNSQLLDLLFF